MAKEVTTCPGKKAMLSKCSSRAWPGLVSASRPGTARSLHLHRQAQTGPQACKEQPVPEAPAASGSAAVYQKLVDGKRFTCTQVRSVHRALNAC